jgi:hypothetical protein
MELNGESTLGRLAERSGLNLGNLREVISKLLKSGLIEEVQQDHVMLDGDFFRCLVSQLSLAIGPIASILIEEEIHYLGYEVNQFPVYRVTELVDKLAAEIRLPEKKSIFMRNMVNKIRQKGYPVQ